MSCRVQVHPAWLSSEDRGDAGYEDGQEFLSFCGSRYMASVNRFAARLLGIEQVRVYGGSFLPSGTDA